MRYLTLNEVLELYRRIMQQTGGLPGIHDMGALESAVAQPRMTFGDHELYPTVSGKAAALAFSLIQNHPFTDGNKRTGHAAMEVFLILNGFEIRATTEEQEEVVLQVASGQWGRDQLVSWLDRNVIAKKIE